MQQSTFDLERVVPDQLSKDPIEREMYEFHRARYAFAARFVKGMRVLDLACGVGYGSDILAQAGAAHVLGVDISVQAIEYARIHYRRPNLEFLAIDGRLLQQLEAFDVVVSLETIEHIPDAFDFMKHLVGLLKNGGVFVASVPTTLSSDVNPYHCNDISEKAFREMFRKNRLAIIDQICQVQRFSPIRLRMLGRTSQRKYQFRKSLPAYYAAHPVMLFRRLWATLTMGFVNKYLVLAGKKTK